MKIKQIMHAYTSYVHDWIYLSGRGKTKVQLRVRGTHNKILKLQDGDQVKVTLEKIHKKKK